MSAALAYYLHRRLPTAAELPHSDDREGDRYATNEELAQQEREQRRLAEERLAELEARENQDDRPEQHLQPFSWLLTLDHPHTQIQPGRSGDGGTGGDEIHSGFRHGSDPL